MHEARKTTRLDSVSALDKNDKTMTNVNIITFLLSNKMPLPSTPQINQWTSKSTI